MVTLYCIMMLNSLVASAKMIWLLVLGFTMLGLWKMRSAISKGLHGIGKREFEEYL